MTFGIKDIRAYEEAISELSEEDKIVVNRWIDTVVEEVRRKRYSRSGNRHANFGRSAAIELLHMRLFKDEIIEELNLNTGVIKDMI